MRRILQRLGRTLGRVGGAWLLRLWHASLRTRESGREAVTAAWAQGPVIVVFWHSRLLMLPFVYPRERTIGVLISPSADGDLIAAIIEALGRQTVRGSSRRGGANAAVEMEARMREGWDVAIAIDGPLGPAYRCKPGAARLALALNRPVVPLCYTSNRGLALSTWDRFWLPAPFSAVTFDWGEPIYPATNDDTDTLTTRIEQTLRNQFERAETTTGRTLPWAS